MAHNYTHESGSDFPDRLLQLSYFRDIDESVFDLVSQIYSLQDAAKYDEAKKLLEQNAGLLKPYIISNETLNRLTEELYNTQIFAYTTLQQIFISDKEPEVGIRKGDFWEQEY